MGTVGYMAPEQAQRQQVDKRADIWAFGVILFELLSGQRLFDGTTVQDSSFVVASSATPTAACATSAMHCRW